MIRLLGAGLVVSSLMSLVAQAPVREATPGGMETGITVEGTGEATVPADTLEYRAMLVTGGATPAEAMTEYERGVARLQKALDQLGMKGLTHELRGVLFVCLNDDQFRQRQRN